MKKIANIELTQQAATIAISNFIGDSSGYLVRFDFDIYGQTGSQALSIGWTEAGLSNWQTFSPIATDTVENGTFTDIVLSDIGIRAHYGEFIIVEEWTMNDFGVQGVLAWEGDYRFFNADMSAVNSLYGALTLSLTGATGFEAGSRITVYDLEA